MTGIRTVYIFFVPVLALCLLLCFFIKVSAKAARKPQVDARQDIVLSTVDASNTSVQPALDKVDLENAIAQSSLDEGVVGKRL